jgi:hypothetical protein
VRVRKGDETGDKKILGDPILWRRRGLVDLPFCSPCSVGARRTFLRHAITAKQFDAILPFLDAFERMGFKCGEWPDASESLIPHFTGSDPVEAFVQTLNDNGWIEDFDWGGWQDTAAQYVDSPERLASADPETIRRLLTMHVRKNRFCEGHLACMFENGYIVALLRRLKDIRNELKR